MFRLTDFPTAPTTHRCFRGNRSEPLRTVGYRERVTLGFGAGLQLSAISYGAAVQELWAPDRDGRRANIVLGFADIDGYTREPEPLLRRDRRAGRQPHRRRPLHAERTGPMSSPRKQQREFPSRRAARLRQTGMDDRGGGDRCLPGPGPTSSSAIPALTERWAIRDPSRSRPPIRSPRARFEIDLAATTDKPTIVNLTAHPLWNLAGEGEGTTDDHLLTLRARRYTRIDNEALLPTGEVTPVSGTPLDFTLQLPSAPGSTTTSTSSPSPEATTTTSSSIAKTGD